MVTKGKGEEATGLNKQRSECSYISEEMFLDKGLERSISLFLSMGKGQGLMRPPPPPPSGRQAWQLSSLPFEPLHQLRKQFLTLFFPLPNNDLKIVIFWQFHIYIYMYIFHIYTYTHI